MKEILDFIEENIFSIFLSLALLLFIGFIPVVLINACQSDLFNLEEKCFIFYKENNYILDECYKYSDKLKGE